MDSANLGLANTEDLGNSFLSLNPGKGTYSADFGLGNFRTTMPLADSLSAVNLHVRHIFGVRFPNDVRFSHASEMTVAARVSRLMLKRRARTFYMLANKRMDILHATIDADGAVTLACLAVWPLKAFIVFVRQHHFIEVALRLAWLRSDRADTRPGGWD
jgi:hypothetical protein